MILHFNLMTPGRMKEETKEVKTSLAFDYDDLAISFVEALVVEVIVYLQTHVLHV